MQFVASPSPSKPAKGDYICLGNVPKNRIIDLPVYLPMDLHVVATATVCLSYKSRLPSE